MVIAPQGSPATGEDAPTLASRLFASATDNSSCLNAALRDDYAAVRAIYASRGIDQQLVDGAGEEAVAVAREEATTRAKALGLADLWAAALRAFAVPEEEPVAVLPKGGAAQGAAAGGAAKAEPRHAATHVELRLHGDSNASGVLSAARRSLADRSGSQWGAWLSGHRHEGLVAAVVAGNAVAVMAVGAIWTWRRRSRAQAGRRRLLAAEHRGAA